MMKADDAKNTIDSAHPHPEAADRLSEEEKKALELSGLAEHADGPEKTELTELTAAAQGLGEGAK